MPLHFGSITQDSQDSRLLEYLIHDGLDGADVYLASKDKKYLHVARYMRDSVSGDRIGKIVYTLFNDHERKTLQILDIDIVLDGGQVTQLNFLQKLPDSSDANEYYDVEVVDGQQHLRIETVNRHCVDGEILGSTQEVLASAFPFRLSIHEDIDALNRELGFKERPIRLGDTEMKMGGLSPTFAAPSDVFHNQEFDGEVFSYVIGVVKSTRDVTIEFGERSLPFTIVLLESALGSLPTAVSREVFDLEELAPGKVISMFADIKADFAVYQ